MINGAVVMKPIIYQLFPRWFTNVNAHCVPGGTIEQNGSGKMNDITPDVLEAIKSLGVSHVWYTGVLEHATKTDFSAFGIAPCHKQVVKGEAGSPYAIRDYYDVSPELAVDVPRRMDEWRNLVKRTHDAGLKVIIDFVPNHVAREYASDAKPEGVEDLGASDDRGMFFEPQNNFYYITGQAFVPPVSVPTETTTYHEFPARATGNDCWTASPGNNDWYETVKLNYGVDPWNGSRHFEPIPDTWHKMLDIMLYWAAMGIDGMRCDMVHMVPVEFWQWAIAQVKERYPRFFFIAEIYDVGLYRDYIHRGGFDYLYNKVTLYDTLCRIMCAEGDTQAITSCWQTVDDIRDHMLNFLENHDEVRLASEQLCGDAAMAKPALVVSAAISRCPMMIYAGQELGERATDAEGFSGYDGRTTIFDYWSVPSIRHWLSRENLNRRNPLRDYYRRVLTACNDEPSIAVGEMYDLMYANPHLHRQYVFLRYHQGEYLLIAANFEPEQKGFSVTIPNHAFDHCHLPCGELSAIDILHRRLATLNLMPDKPFRLTVPANDAVMFKFGEKN